MLILRGKRYPAPCVLLLGGFDGFHKGHAALLNEAKKCGLPVGLTSIAGCKAGGDVFTLAEREIIFERAGFSFVREIEFTEEFKNTSAEDFVKELFLEIPVKALFCGEDFRFGRGASGTGERLKELAPCPVNVLPLTKSAGEKISASRLKKLVGEGETEALNALLSFPYFIEGIVEHGRQVGRTLGFPTANVSFGKGKLPLKEGVYGGRAETDSGTYRAVINVGSRPTFGVGEVKIEAHLQDFDGDLYGKRVLVFPERYLRPVAAFRTEGELISQLEKDKRKWFYD